MVVEGGEPLGRRRLHHRPPAAPERFLDQRRQHRLERLALEVVEQDLRHGAQIAPKSPPLPLPDENRAAPAVPSSSSTWTEVCHSLRSAAATGSPCAR